MVWKPEMRSRKVQVMADSKTAPSRKPITSPPENLTNSRQPFLSRNYGLKMVGEDKPIRNTNGAKV